MEFSLVYMTAGSAEEAKSLAAGLVESKLAACANILDNMQSVYWWKGQVQREHECIVIAKTKRSLVPDLIEKIKSLHSYECPCVVSIPIQDGNQPFLDWIEAQTR